MGSKTLTQNLDQFLGGRSTDIYDVVSETSGLGLITLDISDPSNPCFLDSYNTPHEAANVTVQDNIAYVADCYEGLRIFNVSDPSNLIEVGYYDTPGFAYNVFIQDHLAYVSDSDQGVRIIDVSDPTLPYEIGHYDQFPYPFSSEVYDLVVSNHYCFAAAYNNGLRILDVSVPQTPTEIDYYLSPFYMIESIVITDDRIILSDSVALWVIDISHPDNPITLTYYEKLAIYDMAIQGHLMYMASDYDGVIVMDISDPMNLVEISRFDMEYGADKLIVQDMYAYIITQSTKFDDFDVLTVLNIADPENIYQIGQHEIYRHVRHFDVSNSTIFAIDYDSHLHMIDVMDPSNPVDNVVSSVEFYDLVLSENYAFVTALYDNFYVLDISDPYNIAEVTHYETLGFMGEIGIYRNNIYISGGHEDEYYLWAINITDPGNPYEVNIIQLDYILGIQYVSYPYAVLSSIASFQLYDLTNCQRSHNRPSIRP